MDRVTDLKISSDGVISQFVTWGSSAGFSVFVLLGQT